VGRRTGSGARDTPRSSLSTDPRAHAAPARRRCAGVYAPLV